MEADSPYLCVHARAYVQIKTYMHNLFQHHKMNFFLFICGPKSNYLTKASLTNIHLPTNIIIPT